MTLYLTPERFRTLGLGSNLDRFEGKDVELASILNSASTMVDAYCAVSLKPQRHSFLGGSITAEQHSYRLAQNPFEQTQRRVYPFHAPIRTCSRFRIFVTQPDPDVDDGQYVNVAVTDLMINRTVDYIEVVSSVMTSTGLFNALIVPSIYLASPLATIDYTYGYDFEVVDEPLYPVDGLIYQSQNNFWTDADAEIKVDGVAMTTGFTINRTEGWVQFDSAPGSVTASYHHKLPVEIRDATGLIASHLIERANVAGSGLSELQSIDIAGQIRVTKSPRDVAQAEGTRAYIDQHVPGANTLLVDFIQWRIAA